MSYYEADLGRNDLLIMIIWKLEYMKLKHHLQFISELRKEK